MGVRRVEARGLAAEAGLYSHALAVRGEQLYVSGQVPVDERGELAGTDVAAQARQVFANIEAVLRSAGAGLDALVRLTVYLVDNRDVKPFADVRKELLVPPYPTSTLVIVKALLDPAWRVEVDAIAVLD